MIQNNLISGIYDLHYIVSSVMADLGEKDNSKFKQLLKWAIDGYRRLNLAGSFDTTIKTVRLPMSSSNTIDIPLDYVDYIKIGVCINGYLCNFDHHPSLCIDEAKYKKNACGDEEVINTLDNFSKGNVTPSNFINWGYTPHFHNGQHVAGYYGLGEGFSGRGYKMDLKNRKIHFSSYVEVDEVILEYKTKGIDSTGNAIIPETAIPVLNAFVHWKRNSFEVSKRTNRVDLNQAMYWKNEFQREFKGMTRRENAMTKDEWLTVIRSSIHQLPKR